MTVKSYLNEHEGQKEVLLFMSFNFIAMLVQVFSRIGLDLCFTNVQKMVKIWPFEAQALGSFLAFLLANIIGKTVSYSLNRRKTFNAHNSLMGLVIYYAMIIVIICVESIVGTPLRNLLYLGLGGIHDGKHLMTDSVTRPVLYQLCGVFSQWICGLVDQIIIFVMDKYVIMRCNN